MGAVPKYLTCAFVIEEGFEIKKLEEIAEAMEKTALEVMVFLMVSFDRPICLPRLTARSKKNTDCAMTNAMTPTAIKNMKESDLKS